MPSSSAQTRSFSPRDFFWAILALVLTITLPLLYRTVQPHLRHIPNIIAPLTTSSAISMAATTADASSYSRMPVYFLGIGGPNFMEAKDHPAFKKLEETGREIISTVKPKAIVVFSAHWQHGPNTVAINVAEKMDLIYDFYGFPPHYYEYDFPNKGSPELAENVITKLSTAGIEVDKVMRGLDHGVWVGLLAAFDPKKNPLNVPIVQVSLFANEDPNQHYRIGQSLEALRDEGVLIIGAGMAVHNLNDFRRSRGSGKLMPYASTFEEGLQEVVSTDPEKRKAAMMTLLKRKDAREAHPTLEHILPLYVAAGAAGQDVGQRLWAFPEGSLNWAQYRFGDIPVN